ncbi:IS110 family transposase [Deinococcus cellulosilyticus]|uniref:Transposase n=1 Tax=Deinococcus cellulosilyticus (strain DSM 18568 / NBRC 106333 / KACC 11606 / 5516J-15) TaxID=1223518 RepID=A0A511MYX2_DEIC1|nr:IS110 family transposase [Deinococcus cellulosilyticus]GEM45541.1 hypothetical protein DC3_11760 [Deinococcus cellulosilyticus NBRC 106333 = KACC 11606]
MTVVGVDIACDTFVAYHPADKHPRSFANTTAGFRTFQDWLNKLSGDSNLHLVMEATGV